MADFGKIEDIGQLEEWLKMQDVPMRGAIAARASLRSLPAVMAIVDQKVESFDGEAFLTSALRATLASGVASLCPTPDTKVRSAVLSAADCASTSYNVTQAASHAARSSADSAFSAIRSATLSTALSAVRSSTLAAAESAFFAHEAALDSPLPLPSPPLYAADEATLSAALNDGTVGKMQPLAEKIFEHTLWSTDHRVPAVHNLWLSFAARPDPTNIWQFWIEWYQGMLDGAPMAWDLQLQIALIEDAIWNSGPEAVAAEIEAIKAQFLSEKAPLAEVVKFDDNIGAFRVIPQEIAKPTLLAATLSQVEDALDVVLADPSNGLNERSRETQVLRRSLLKYSNDPQRIEMDFFSAHAGLTRQILVEDLPPSEANLALQRALEEGAQAVRATHPDVAENRHILNSQKIAELSTDQKAKLAGAQPLLEAISSGVMQEDFSDDIAYLLEDHFRVPTFPPEFVAKHRNPILAESDEKYRTFGRLAQIAIQLLKSPQILDRIDGSAGYKAATIFLTVKELINLCIGLI